MSSCRKSVCAPLFRPTFLAALALAAVASCGGGDSGGSCPAPQTCGGNIVGTWKVQSSCASADPSFAMTMDCPTATGDVSKLTFTGSVTFSADGVETSSLIPMGSMSMTMPSSCLNTAQATMATCELLAQAVAANLDQNSPFASPSCKVGGGGCICTFAAKGTPSNTTGPYTTSGGTLSDTNSDGEPTTSSYCVSGQTLSLTNDMDGLRLSATLTRQ